MEHNVESNIREGGHTLPSSYEDAVREQIMMSAQFQAAQRLIDEHRVFEENMLARPRRGLLAPIRNFITNARIRIRRRRLGFRIARLLESYQSDFSYEQFLDGLEDVATGLEKSVIDSIPLRPVTASDTGEDGEAQCPICFEAVPLGELLARLPCGHSFHHKCISSWYERKSTCPSCRARYSAPAEEQNAGDESENNEAETSEDNAAARASGVTIGDGVFTEA
ncbi:hypothetical protein CERZMDRAFT_83917 [Cercospora zeae-maydis SCOH1-5]|uniref:RING-type domain-containing protein n=1 Tax=Cercospora zeae-maydis SCOH1-5 TaxID=717836 RepID=A0A6A6FHT9_9PEZI|nr:hypothetical protein CERZMDRAFT_83917 [Cercospora zeae-maydis SCOH1-5]